ncbi:hypothetical protein [Cupriavidus metallidurans]|uniref:hypothetical protein n=1 Tax=Cupriavidus metallidurans TaxID=119219 RepID=UPI00056036F2|nr:hypothetical protein [Cupriavidus metallidurans]
MLAANRPDWLAPLVALRTAGRVPPAGYIALSLGVALPRRMLPAAMFVPADYWPRHTDDLTAMRGIDAELIFTTRESFARLRNLTTSLVAAGIHRLVAVCADAPALIVLLPGCGPDDASDRGRARATVEAAVAAGLVGTLTGVSHG